MKNSIRVIAIVLIVFSFILTGCNEKVTNKVFVGKDKGYKVEKEEELDKKKKINISYPKVIIKDNKILEKKINGKFDNIVDAYKQSTFKEIFLGYRDKKSDDKILSILFEGKAVNIDNRDVFLKDSININMKNGVNITYENFINKKDEVKKLLDKKLKVVDSKLKLEKEKFRIYFEGDEIIFYFKPVKQKVEQYLDVAIKMDDIRSYINTSIYSPPSK